MVKKMNGTQAGNETVQRVQQWINERDALQDYDEYKRAGKINRSVLASELSFSRSSFGTNKALEKLVKDAEMRWYPQTKTEDKKAIKAASERSERRSELTSAENSKLKDENARLKAENLMLKGKLRKFQAMADVLAEYGSSPRGVDLS